MTASARGPSQGDTYGDGDGTAAVHAGRLWTSRGQVLDAATGAKLRDYRSSQIPAFGDGLALLADAGCAGGGRRGPRAPSAG